MYTALRNKRKIGDIIMSNELAVLDEKAITQAFVKNEDGEYGIKYLFEKLKQQTVTLVPDLSTKKGRDEIASNAYKVSRSKALVDSHGKELVADIKAQAKIIDGERKWWRDECDKLRDEIRQPLTDFENAEKERIANHEKNLSALVIDIEFMSASDIEQAINNLQDTKIGDDWEEFKVKALEVKDSELSRLHEAFAKQFKSETEQAELERLRKEQLEREKKEREERIAREAADKAKAEAEAKAKAELEAVAKREAKLLAEKEALELKAKQDAENAKREAQKQIEAERQRIENERIAQEEAEAKRKADLLHCQQIHKTAKEALMSNCNLTCEQAVAVVKAIKAGLITNVTINY